MTRLLLVNFNLVWCIFKILILLFRSVKILQKYIFLYTQGAARTVATSPASDASFGLLSVFLLCCSPYNQIIRVPTLKSQYFPFISLHSLLFFILYEKNLLVYTVYTAFLFIQHPSTLGCWFVTCNLQTRPHELTAPPILYFISHLLFHKNIFAYIYFF